MLKAISPEEKDVVTALWYQTVTFHDMGWMVTATVAEDVLPRTFSGALGDASKSLDLAWRKTQVTKEDVLAALRPLCRFVCAFVTEVSLFRMLVVVPFKMPFLTFSALCQAEVGDSPECVVSKPHTADPVRYGINPRGLARMTAVTHGFWVRRSQVARFSVSGLVACRPASDREVERVCLLCDVGEFVVCFPRLMPFFSSQGPETCGFQGRRQRRRRVDHDGTQSRHCKGHAQKDPQRSQTCPFCRTRAVLHGHAGGGPRFPQRRPQAGIGAPASCDYAWGRYRPPGNPCPSPSSERH